MQMRGSLTQMRGSLTQRHHTVAESGTQERGREGGFVAGGGVCGCVCWFVCLCD